MKSKILIVDDEQAICVSLKYTLGKEYDVDTANTASEALRATESELYQLVLLDVYLGDQDGIELLKEIKQRSPETIVIVMTAHGSIRSSVTAMRSGAFSYMAKPLDMEELKIFIQQGLHYRSLNEKISYLSDELQSRYQYGEMIGKSSVMQSVYELVKKLKDVDTPVIVNGESGTGKELAARAIHFTGARQNERFIEVNCAAIPEGLLEMEFFGYRKGAFTGAAKDKMGKFEAADKGTIFLDEIGDMPLPLQGKLLRVLQEKSYTPIGGTEKKWIDVRVIAATNRNLWDMVQVGSFRQDLYYRLNVVTITLPPLRERRQDIPLLVSRFIAQLSKEQGRSIQGATKEAERILLLYDYPGNVRELLNAIEYAVIMCDGAYLCPADLPPQFLTQKGKNFPPLNSEDGGGTLHEIERRAILQALSRNGGHQRRTAEELGISTRGLRNKLNEYGYEKDKLF